MSEINRRDINRCTCHCGGDMFYRHLHAASCPVSVDGDEAPISENADLRAEVERLTRERDEAVKRNNEDSAILALSGNQVAWFAGKLADIERKYLAIQREQKAQDVQLDAVRYRAEQAEQQLAASQARVQELEVELNLTADQREHLNDSYIVLEQERDRLRTALAFYADPSTYHACLFAFDRPTGGFDEDFDEGHEGYDRPMPGKLAREALRGAGEDKRNAEGPAIDPPARGDFPPEPS